MLHHSVTLSLYRPTAPKVGMSHQDMAKYLMGLLREPPHVGEPWLSFLNQPCAYWHSPM